MDLSSARRIRRQYGLFYVKMLIWLGLASSAIYLLVRLIQREPGSEVPSVVVLGSIMTTSFTVLLSLAGQLFDSDQFPKPVGRGAVIMRSLHYEAAAEWANANPGAVRLAVPADRR